MLAWLFFLEDSQIELLISFVILLEICIRINLLARWTLLSGGTLLPRFEGSCIFLSSIASLLIWGASIIIDVHSSEARPTILSARYFL